MLSQMECPYNHHARGIRLLTTTPGLILELREFYVSSIEMVMKSGTINFYRIANVSPTSSNIK